jgi:hypothetical protein
MKFRFPAKISSPARSSFLDPSLFFNFFLFYRGDAVAKMNNNTPYFGMTVKYSRPKWWKIDDDGECPKAAPGGVKTGIGT